MQSFVCDKCNETVKKPKAEKHLSSASKCQGAQFTCVDCSTKFAGDTYKSHTCVSEAEKRRKEGSPKKKKGNEQSSSVVEPSETAVVKTEEQDEQPSLPDTKKKREKKKKHRDQEVPGNRLPDSAEPHITKVENGTGDEGEHGAEPSKPKEKKRGARAKPDTQKDKKQQRKQDSGKAAKDQSKKTALDYNTDSDSESEPALPKKRRKEGDTDAKKPAKKRKRPSTKEGMGSPHYSTTSDEDASNSDSSTKKRKLSDNTISSDEEMKSKEQDSQKSRAKATSPGSSDEGPKRKVVRRPKLVGDAANFPESIPVTVRWVMRHNELKEISYHQLREYVIEEYTRKKQNHCSREEIKKALAKNFVIVHNPRSISLKLPRSSRKQGGGGAEKSSDEE